MIPSNLDDVQSNQQHIQTNIPEQLNPSFEVDQSQKQLLEIQNLENQILQQTDFQEKQSIGIVDKEVKLNLTLLK